MKTWIRIITVLLLAGTLLAGTLGCETMQGADQDRHDTGESGGYSY